MKQQKNLAKATYSQGQKATIHQATTMLATSKNVLFLYHNHLLTIGADDSTLWLSPEPQPSNTSILFLREEQYFKSISFFKVWTHSHQDWSRQMTKQRYQGNSRTG